MTLTQLQHLSDAQKQQILAIWNTEFPAVIGFKTIDGLESYLKNLAQPVHFVISDNAELANPVIGWLATFSRDGSRWFVMLVSSNWQRKGLGTMLIKAMQRTETDVSGWIAARGEYSRADGSAYKAPASFYEKLGFEITSTEVDHGVITSRKIVWSRPRR